MKKYENLKDQYPDTISLDQLYRICGIAKRSAAYLIRHGVIPAVDTGRKTWRYRIALDDVIAYLQKRDRVGSMIPCGAVTSRYGRTSKLVSCDEILTGDNEEEVAEYFAYVFTDYPDVLTVEDVMEMTGFCKATILRFLKASCLKAIEKRPKYLIVKTHLLEFFGTPRFIKCKSNSEVFVKIIGGFEIWKAAK